MSVPQHVRWVHCPPAPAPSESSHTHELWAADDSGAISDTSPVESPRQDPGDEQSESPSLAAVLSGSAVRATPADADGMDWVFAKKNQKSQKPKKTRFAKDLKK